MSSGYKKILSISHGSELQIISNLFEMIIIIGLS